MEETPAILRIFDVQRFSYHDGPGIRTVVFFKGCNLRCFWCQNPESQSGENEILFYAEKCIGCGKCGSICPENCHVFLEGGGHFFRRELCRCCGRCTQTCYAEALRMAGRTATVEEIVDEVLKDRAFYRLSGGGVTLSGGEPLLQAAGCLALLRACRRAAIHTALETAGRVPWPVMAEILPYVDELLLDIKTADGERHRTACGAGNGHVRANLGRLKEAVGPRLTVRVPIVPGVNDREQDVARIVALVEGCPNLRAVELLPFHKLGAVKYQALGRVYAARDLREPDAVKMEPLRAVVRARLAAVQQKGERS